MNQTPQHMRLARRRSIRRKFAAKPASTRKLRRHYRNWTASEVMKLGDLWERGSEMRVIRRVMGRSRRSIFEKAKRLGLTLGCPEGFEYLTDAFKRVGVCNSNQMRSILNWAGVKIRTTLSSEKATTHFVDPFEVDDAMKRWCNAETLRHASRRHRIRPRTLRVLIVEHNAADPGPNKKPHWRLDPDVVDKLVSEYRKARKGA
jgi:hypothetical protein